jgi:hypothetical protein
VAGRGEAGTVAVVVLHLVEGDGRVVRGRHGDRAIRLDERDARRAAAAQQGAARAGDALEAVDEAGVLAEEAL